MNAALQHFYIALRAAGLDYPGEIIADSKLHRFKAADDYERNSWYVIHAGSPIAGAFGCWKRGIKETWCEKRRENFTDAEWRTIHENWKLADDARKRMEAERHGQARKVAAWILARAKPLMEHAYLTAKRVKIYGDLCEYRGALVLPLRDADGELHSLQFIGTDGNKKFLTAGKIFGCFFSISDQPDGALVICEGYATGASVHAATGGAVVCAMNCHNMKAVAEAMRKKFQAREIIIASDCDAWTGGNPGLTKALEAAKVIGAKLVVPQFTDATTKPTDFNDLDQLEGLDTVKTQINNAAIPNETDSEIFDRLAKLSPADYDRCREDEAKRLKIRVATLDSEIQKNRPKSGETLQGCKMNLADVELWPEAVNGADVLSEIADTFARYVALPDGAGDAIALWAAHTHCFESFLCSPRLNISSPEKGCGKTTLRDVLAVFMPRALATENLTAPVLFRVIQSNKPTVLADECDAWLRDNEELRGMFNAGHRRGGKALRCEGDGHEVRAFDVFAPAVLCGIGALPGTLHDRSIIVRLERAKPGELRERFDSRRIERETELCRKLARFCADNKARLEACDPALPSGAFNRLADNWRPLFAIAEVAGGDWPQRAADAFMKLTGKVDWDAQDIGTMLLTDIRQIFAGTDRDRIFSKSLVDSLCAMSERPWPEVHHGKPVSETWLARRLRGFGINSRTLRIGDQRAKGYETADFADAFDRYLSAEEQSKRDSVTMPENISDSQFSKRDTKNNVTVSNPHETLESIELSRCHASPAPVLEDREEMLL